MMDILEVITWILIIISIALLMPIGDHRNFKRSILQSVFPCSFVYIAGFLALTRGHHVISFMAIGGTCLLLFMIFWELSEEWSYANGVS